MSDLGLAHVAGRCAHGFAPVHHPQFCGCTDMTEWVIFTTALSSATCRKRCDVTCIHIHQDDVRPLIKGRIEPKHIGQLYKRAKTEGLLRPIGKERSGDVEGRNTHHDSPVYALSRRAA